MAHLTASVQFQLAAQFAADSPMAIMSIMWHRQPQQQQPRVIPTNAQREGRDVWVKVAKWLGNPLSFRWIYAIYDFHFHFHFDFDFDFYLFATS